MLIGELYCAPGAHTGLVCDRPLWCAPGVPAKLKSKSQVAYIGISAMTWAALQMIACVTSSSCACSSSGKFFS